MTLVEDPSDLLPSLPILTIRSTPRLFIAEKYDEDAKTIKVEGNARFIRYKRRRFTCFRHQIRCIIAVWSLDAESVTCRTCRRSIALPVV